MNNEDIVSLMERYKRELLEFEKRNTAPVSAQEKAEPEPVSAQQESQGFGASAGRCRACKRAGGRARKGGFGKGGGKRSGERRGDSYNSAADRRSEGESDAV